MGMLIAKTLDGEIVEFDPTNVAASRIGGKHRCWVKDEILGTVEVDPKSVRCASFTGVPLAREVLALLEAINAWFGENPDAAPHEPPWAKDFYALMEKLEHELSANTNTRGGAK